MTEPNIEEIATQIDCGIRPDLDALECLIASWRERREKIEILEAEIRVMRKLPSAIDAALGDKP